MSSTSYEIAGRTVTMPCQVRDASAGSAMFEVDAAAAQRLLPGGSFEIVEAAPGRCQLALVVIDYRDNDLGDYDEFGVTFFVTPRGRPDGEPGTFIYRLPVDQRFTCEAGRAIWGFPKSVDDIAIGYTATSATCTLRMDDELVLRLSLPRGGHDDMPSLRMTTYTYIDRVPHRTAFTQGGRGAQVLVGGEGVELELGDHPLAKELASLGLPATPVMTTWTEQMRGTFEAPERLG